jgi:hypothetical protein
MSDHYVTVATFYVPYEAELARGLLAGEGIESFVFGALSSSVISGGAMFGDQTKLQVHEKDAPRATQILAAQAAHVKLKDNEEDQAEEETWLCTLCGSVVSREQLCCVYCQTPRDAVQEASPDQRLAVQTEPTPSLDREGIQQQPLLTAPRPEAAAPAKEDEDEAPEPPPLPNEERARSAFGMALMGWFFPLPIFPLYSLWLMFRLTFDPQELSPRGERYFYLSLTLNGLYVLALLILYGVIFSW